MQEQEGSGTFLVHKLKDIYFRAGLENLFAIMGRMDCRISVPGGKNIFMLS